MDECGGWDWVGDLDGAPGMGLEMRMGIKVGVGG